MQPVMTNDIKRQRIINQYKNFYTLYYEAVERQCVKNASAQNRGGCVVNVITHTEELNTCQQN